MKLLELYSLATGLKIGKQWLLEQFFPLPFTKYITLHASSGMGGKNYPMWPQVVELTKPYLSANGIEIVQIGAKDDPAVPSCYHTMGKDNIHQGSYIVRNALLHVCNDSVWAHRAGHLNVPIVEVFGPTSVANHSPYQYDKDNTIFLESHRWGRNPTFAAQENPLSIALVDPFDVARAVLKLLKIEATIPQHTLHIGQSYQQTILELIPNCAVDRSFNPDLPLAIRMDLEHNETALVHMLQMGRKVNIVTKAPITLGLLQTFAPSILSYNHEVSDDTSPTYIAQVKKLIKQHIFFSRTKDEDVLARLRFALFDVTNVEQVADKTRADFERSIQEYTNDKTQTLDSHLKSATMMFKAQKYVLSKGKIYLSLAHEKADLPMDSPIGNHVIDSDDWFRDANHFFVHT